MRSNLIDFVNETISEISEFDGEKLECIKKVVRKAIDFYQLKSYEEVEETHLGTISFLHINSIVEENLLSKVVEISTNNKKDLRIEGVYDGHVIRDY